MYVVVKIRKGWNGGNEVSVSRPYSDHAAAEAARRRTHLDHVLGPDYYEFTNSGQCETFVCPMDTVSA